MVYTHFCTGLTPDRHRVHTGLTSVGWLFPRRMGSFSGWRDAAPRGCARDAPTVRPRVGVVSLGHSSPKLGETYSCLRASENCLPRGTGSLKPIAMRYVTHCGVSRQHLAPALQQASDDRG